MAIPSANTEQIPNEMFALLLAYQLVQLCPRDAVLGMAVQLLVGHWVGLLILQEG